MNWPTHLKKTKQRLAIYELLEKNKYPMTVEKIYQELISDQQDVWLSTIYRTLDLFVKESLVEKKILENKQVLYSLKQFHGHHHYAICTDCHKTIELNRCTISSYAHDLSEQDFFVKSHKIEIYGQCKECHDLKLEK